MSQSSPKNNPVRTRLKRWWHNYEWPIVIALGILAIVLSYIGLRIHLPQVEGDNTAFDLLYRSLMLFVIDSGSMEGIESPIVWQLNIARFLAAFVALYTVVQALTAIFSEQLQSLRMRCLKNHVIICGLGRKGYLLSKSFCAEGHKVMVIELDRDNDMIDSCREHGAKVLIGNAATDEVLHRARVEHARYVISVCGDDGVNVEVAVISRSLISKQKALTCIVHIVESRLCHMLREQEIESQDVDQFRLEFFNVYESGASVLLSEHSPFESLDKTGHPHVLIVGLGSMGRSLLVQIARRWKIIQPDEIKKIAISVVDRDAERKVKSLCLRYPKLETVSTIHPFGIETDSIEYEAASFLSEVEGKGELTHVFVCFDGDSSGLSAALTLNRRFRDKKIPIAVRTAHDAGLAVLLKQEKGGLANLNAFSILDSSLKPHVLLKGTYDILARAIHEDYRQLKIRNGDISEGDPSMLPWAELAEDLRESNLEQAGHVGNKLKAVNCEVVPLDDWDADLFEFEAGQVELLADMEHQRWVKERERKGWKPGPRDPDKKISPYLVPYAELEEKIKEYDRNTVRRLPAVLALAGYEIRKRSSF